MHEGQIEFQEENIVREERWLAEQEKITRLETLGTDQLMQAFEGEPGVCTCVDEGTDGDIRIAGSGILHPGGIEAVARIVQAAGVKEVTSHEHCGAVTEAYRRAHGLPADAAIDQTEVNAYGQAWSIRLSERLGVPYRNIATEEMLRPSDWHDAATIYLDFSGKFQPHKVAALPKGFVLSGNLLRPDELLADATFTAGLALSDKGFGERFTAEHPLVVVTVGDPGEDYQAVLNELKAKHSGRLVVKHLAVPETTDVAA